MNEQNIYKVNINGETRYAVCRYNARGGYTRPMGARLDGGHGTPGMLVANEPGEMPLLASLDDARPKAMRLYGYAKIAE